jgi:hypothetical protein
MSVVTASKKQMNAEKTIKDMPLVIVIVYFRQRQFV